MSKSKHTPGPWTDSEKADGTGRRVIHGPAGLLIAVVPHAGNARLIATAPDGLKLAKAVLAATNWSVRWEEIIAMARRVVEAAEPKETR